METNSSTLGPSSGRILVIEDEPELRELLELELASAGFDVLTAENGQVGLEQALAHRPTIALCDIMMPVLDGYGFLRKARFDHPELDMMQIMFLTAKGDPQDVIMGLALGVDDYIAKPFDFGLLISQISARINQIRRITEHHDRQLVKVYRNFTDRFVRPATPEADESAADAPAAALPLIAVCSADVTDRADIAKAARDSGFECFETGSGEELMKRIGEIKPRAVFLSYRTDDVAGFYLANALKTETEGGLPVIFLVGANAPDIAKTQLPRSYDDVLRLADIDSTFGAMSQPWKSA